MFIYIPSNTMHVGLFFPLWDMCPDSADGLLLTGRRCCCSLHCLQTSHTQKSILGSNSTFCVGFRTWRWRRWARWSQEGACRGTRRANPRSTTRSHTGRDITAQAGVSAQVPVHQSIALVMRSGFLFIHIYLLHHPQKVFAMQIVNYEQGIA